ncbi:MAG: YdcF family protein [Acidimicrobiales bacterium]
MGILATLTGLRLLRFILRLVAFVVTLILIYLVVTAVQVWMTSRRYEPRSAGAIVVMGAAQYDGVPSPDLASRLDEAEILWRQHLSSTIMVTGWKEPGDRFTEAQASEHYLVAAGIPGRDILEAGGSNTWESLSEAAPSLLARGDRTVLIASDPFHEARCLAIASSLGLTAYPTPTRTSPIKGFSTIPYFAKETVGMALGRIIGFDRLSSLHTSLG